MCWELNLQPQALRLELYHKTNLASDNGGTELCAQSMANHLQFGSEQ